MPKNSPLYIAEGDIEMTESPRSGARPWLIGCSIAFAVVVIACVLFGYFGMRYVTKLVDKTMADFKAKGFTQTVQGQDVTVAEPITAPTVFVAQRVTINADCDTDLAIIAQQATINGHVKGVTYFVGQTITIGPNAVLDRNLDVTGQIVTVQGKIKGSITGRFQTRSIESTDAVGGADLSAPINVKSGPITFESTGLAGELGDLGLSTESTQ
jgi:hypothetical protein